MPLTATMIVGGAMGLFGTVKGQIDAAKAAKRQEKLAAELKPYEDPGYVKEAIATSRMQLNNNLMEQMLNARNQQNMANVNYFAARASTDPTDILNALAVTNAQNVQAGNETALASEQMRQQRLSQFYQTLGMGQQTSLENYNNYMALMATRAGLMQSAAQTRVNAAMNMANTGTAIASSAAKIKYGMGSTESSTASPQADLRTLSGPAPSSLGFSSIPPTGNIPSPGRTSTMPSVPDAGGVFRQMRLTNR